MEKIPGDFHVLPRLELLLKRHKRRSRTSWYGDSTIIYDVYD
jgi:hypothetical protein